MCLVPAVEGPHASAGLVPAMTLCAACGVALTHDFALCPHHLGPTADDWATGNRIMCDLLHRGTAPPRLAPDSPDEGSMAAGPDTTVAQGRAR